MDKKGLGMGELVEQFLDNSIFFGESFLKMLLVGFTRFLQAFDR